MFSSCRRKAIFATCDHLFVRQLLIFTAKLLWKIVRILTEMFYGDNEHRIYRIKFLCCLLVSKKKFYSLTLSPPGSDCLLGGSFQLTPQEASLFQCCCHAPFHLTSPPLPLRSNSTVIKFVTRCSISGKQEKHLRFLSGLYFLMCPEN